MYVVDGLAKKKLVKRGKDPKDRRREPLLLEKKGADLFARFPRMDASSVLVRSLQSMTESRRRDFLELLKEFANGLTSADQLYLRAASEEAPASVERHARRAPKNRR